MLWHKTPAKTRKKYPFLSTKAVSSVSCLLLPLWQSPLPDLIAALMASHLMSPGSTPAHTTCPLAQQFLTSPLYQPSNGSNLLSPHQIPFTTLGVLAKNIMIPFFSWHNALSHLNSPEEEKTLSHLLLSQHLLCPGKIHTDTFLSHI